MVKYPANHIGKITLLHITFILNRFSSGWNIFWEDIMTSSVFEKISPPHWSEGLSTAVTSTLFVSVHPSPTTWKGEFLCTIVMTQLKVPEQQPLRQVQPAHLPPLHQLRPKLAPHPLDLPTLATCATVYIKQRSSTTLGSWVLTLNQSPRRG